MYLEIIAGFDPNKPMTEEEKIEYFNKRDALVREFIPTASTSATKELLEKDFVFDKESGEGFYYGLINRKDNSIYFNYYFSDLEFGSGIRKNDKDKRFKYKEWKIFMMKKLAEISVDLAKQYMQDWNNAFEEFTIYRYGRVQRALDEIKECCEIGLDIIEDKTSSV